MEPVPAFSFCGRFALQVFVKSISRVSARIAIRRIAESVADDIARIQLAGSKIMNDYARLSIILNQGTARDGNLAIQQRLPSLRRAIRGCHIYRSSNQNLHLNTAAPSPQRAAMTPMTRADISAPRDILPRVREPNPSPSPTDHRGRPHRQLIHICSAFIRGATRPAPRWPKAALNTHYCSSIMPTSTHWRTRNTRGRGDTRASEDRGSGEEWGCEDRGIRIEGDQQLPTTCGTFQTLSKGSKTY